MQRYNKMREIQNKRVYFYFRPSEIGARFATTEASASPRSYPAGILNNSCCLPASFLLQRDLPPHHPQIKTQKKAGNEEFPAFIRIKSQSSEVKINKRLHIGALHLNHRKNHDGDEQGLEEEWHLSDAALHSVIHAAWQIMADIANHNQHRHTPVAGDPLREHLRREVVEDLVYHRGAYLER